MDDNVVVLNTTTSLDIPPERVIEGAIKADLRAVMVIGWDENDELYAASSLGGSAEILWLLESAKAQLFGE